MWALSSCCGRKAENVKLKDCKKCQHFQKPITISTLFVLANSHIVHNWPLLLVKTNAKIFMNQICSSHSLEFTPVNCLGRFLWGGGKSNFSLHIKNYFKCCSVFILQSRYLTNTDIFLFSDGNSTVIIWMQCEGDLNLKKSISITAILYNFYNCWFNFLCPCVTIAGYFREKGSWINRKLGLHQPQECSLRNKV